MYTMAARYAEKAQAYQGLPKDPFDPIHTRVLFSAVFQKPQTAQKQGGVMDYGCEVPVAEDRLFSR